MAQNDEGDNPSVVEEKPSQQRRVESLGWLTESSVLPKKKRTIEGVGASSIVVLKAELYRSQEEALRDSQGLNNQEERHRKKEGGIGAIYLKKNAGVEERDNIDRLALKAGTRTELDVYAALEKKAELYEKLVRGEVSDEEDEEKYSVDFFRKGLEEPVAKCGSDWSVNDEAAAAAGERVSGTRLREPDSNDGLVSEDMRQKQQRAQWESDSWRTHEDELAAMQRREEQKRVIQEVNAETKEARQRVAALKQKRLEQADKKREKLKAMLLKTQALKQKQKQNQNQNQKEKKKKEMAKE